HADEGQERGHGGASLGLGVRDLALERSLLERDLVEFRRCDLSLARARLADAHGLAVAVEVVPGETEALGRLEEIDEMRPHLERELSLEIRALGDRRRLASARRAEPRAALPRRQDLLLDADGPRHGVADAEAPRVRPSDWQVP